jgi:hypothetical protein
VSFRGEIREVWVKLDEPIYSARQAWAVALLFLTIVMLRNVGGRFLTGKITSAARSD